MFNRDILLNYSSAGARPTLFSFSCRDFKALLHDQGNYGEAPWCIYRQYAVADLVQLTGIWCFSLSDNTGAMFLASVKAKLIQPARLVVQREGSVTKAL